MIAVAKIGGHQAIVEAGDVLEVDKLDAEEGKKVQFEVLLLSEPDGSGFQVGTPFLEGVKVEAKVLEHGRGKKIRVFKMKPRKRYRKTQGHRQDYTLVEIVKIGGAGKTAPKAKAEDKKPSPKKESAPKKAAASTKKTETKAAKKETKKETTA